MWWVILFSSICLLLTYLQSKKQVKNGMLYGFVIMATFLSIRYNYGNDYMSYVSVFDDVNKTNWAELESMTRWVEIGWLVLCKVFNPFGFQCLIAFHTFFVFSSIYYLINKYVPQNWLWLAVFFFLFNSSILIIYISMLRQSLAICCFLLSIDASIEKKLFRTLLWVLLAISTHTSAMITIPFVAFALVYSYFSLPKWVITLLGVSSGLLLTMMVFDRSIADKLLSSAMTTVDLLEERYESHTTGSMVGSGIGLIVNFLVFLPVVLRSKSFDKIELLIIFIFFINMVLFPMEYIVLIFARIRYYFIAFGIFAVPLLMNKTKDVGLKQFLVAIVILINLWTYYLFFCSATFSRAYSVYQVCF